MSNLPAFNPDQPYGEIHGVPGLRYEQNGVRYNVHGKPVSGIYVEPPKSTTKVVEGKRRPGRPKSSKVADAVDAKLEAQVRVEKENNTAKAAADWLND